MMFGFFRVLPLELGTLARDIVLLVVGTGLGVGVVGLLALGAELPRALSPRAWRPFSRPLDVRCRLAPTTPPDP